MDKEQQALEVQRMLLKYAGEYNRKHAPRAVLLWYNRITLTIKRKD